MIGGIDPEPRRWNSKSLPALKASYFPSERENQKIKPERDSAVTCTSPLRCRPDVPVRQRRSTPVPGSGSPGSPGQSKIDILGTPDYPVSNGDINIISSYELNDE
jgi:hypothetical protein